MATQSPAAASRKELATSSAAIPLIPLFKVFVAPPPEMDEELLRVVHSGYVTQGPKVEEFEEALRGFFCTDKVVTLNSATSAIHLALHLLKHPEALWPGLQDHVDEVRCRRAIFACARLPSARSRHPARCLGRS